MARPTHHAYMLKVVTIRSSRIAIEFEHRKRYNLNMWMGLISVALRVVILSGIAMLMLIPTGMCLYADHEDESTSEQHEPGCPKVRKLDQPGKPVQITPDLSSSPLEIDLEDGSANSSGPVFSVGHGPPRGSPLYITQCSLLI